MSSTGMRPWAPGSVWLAARLMSCPIKPDRLTGLSPPVPVSPCTSRDPRAGLEVGASVVGHTEVDHLSDVIGNAEKGRHLLLVIEMEGRPRRAETASAQCQHQGPGRRKNAPVSGRLAKGARILEPSLDARDDVHGHFTEVVSQVAGGVADDLGAILVDGQAWLTRAGIRLVFLVEDLLVEGADGG